MMTVLILYCRGKTHPTLVVMAEFSWNHLVIVHVKNGLLDSSSGETPHLRTMDLQTIPPCHCTTEIMCNLKMK